MTIKLRNVRPVGVFRENGKIRSNGSKREINVYKGTLLNSDCILHFYKNRNRTVVLWDIDLEDKYTKVCDIG